MAECFSVALAAVLAALRRRLRVELLLPLPLLLVMLVRVLLLRQWRVGLLLAPLPLRPLPGK